MSLQKSVNDLDFQLSYFDRYSSVHFMPDTIGDLVFNGVASDVYRANFANGVQGDGAYRINDAHTLRAGFSVTAEKTQNTSLSHVEPCTLCDGTDNVDAPFTMTDSVAKLGWLYGVYVQDEWKLTNQLTINAGLRFDQMDEYVNANQLSPRINVVYQAAARNHVPCRLCPQLHAAAADHRGAGQHLAVPDHVTRRPTPRGRHRCSCSPRCCRNAANVFDVGVSRSSRRLRAAAERHLYQGAAPGLGATASASSWGSTPITRSPRTCSTTASSAPRWSLSGFNYEKAYNEGVELSAKYRNGDFRAYGNVAWAIQKGTNIVSNQFLFGQDELALHR